MERMSPALLKCDCTVRCGDDPWIKTGRALPCAGYVRFEAERARRALVEAEIAAFSQHMPGERGTCDRPPAGWYCTRDDGHTGPCAAWPEGEA